MERPASLGPVEVFEAIQRILEGRDTISFTRHARARMRDRDFTVDDVRRVLDARNRFISGRVGDDAYQNWKYQVSGVDYENVPLVLVVAVEPALGRITIITGKDD